ncbi:hypothetical protein DFR38_12324 [Aquitalea magnusonii]|uniref:Uncharacterized protein n=1 Tax=Aquitalea magnusonii TaxID=332411 RepID=A0A318JNH2_9NEIS|nr:hypothetical protein DFR38_12324 [Aquitalea magnusonii]
MKTSVSFLFTPNYYVSILKFDPAAAPRYYCLISPCIWMVSYLAI